MIYLDGQHFDHREPLPKEEETIDRLKNWLILMTRRLHTQRLMTYYAGF